MTVLDTQLRQMLSKDHLLEQLLLSIVLLKMNSNVLPGLDLLIHFYGATPGQHLLCRVAMCSFQEEFDK